MTLKELKSRTKRIKKLANIYGKVVEKITDEGYEVYDISWAERGTNKHGQLDYVSFYAKGLHVTQLPEETHQLTVITVDWKINEDSNKEAINVNIKDGD